MILALAAGMFLFSNCDSTNEEGTDSFKRSMEDSHIDFKKKNEKNDAAEYEKNYPGDSI